MKNVIGVLHLEDSHTISKLVFESVAMLFKRLGLELEYVHTNQVLGVAMQLRDLLGKTTLTIFVSDLGLDQHLTGEDAVVTVGRFYPQVPVIIYSSSEEHDLTRVVDRAVQARQGGGELIVACRKQGGDKLLEHIEALVTRHPSS